MQKIATRVFVYASLAFGVLGIVLVLTGTEPGDNNAHPVLALCAKLFQVSVFVILSSFALSVAGKYLKTKE